MTVNSSTEFDDQSAQEVQNFDLSDVSVGDYVEIRGYDGGSGIVATRLERDEDPGEVSVRGFVDAVNDPEFTILGITIQTNVDTEFDGADEIPIDAEDFFDQALGSLVEVEGENQGGIIIADEVEFDD